MGSRRKATTTHRRVLVIQLVVGRQPEHKVHQAGHCREKHKVRSKGLHFLLVRLLEHQQLWQDGNGLEVQGDGPRHVRIPVSVKRGVEEERDGDRGDDEVQDPEL